jgi:hypothetical protein
VADHLYAPEVLAIDSRPLPSSEHTTTVKRTAWTRCPSSRSMPPSRTSRLHHRQCFPFTQTSPPSTTVHGEPRPAYPLRSNPHIAGMVLDPTLTSASPPTVRIRSVSHWRPMVMRSPAFGHGPNAQEELAP